MEIVLKRKYENVIVVAEYVPSNQKRKNDLKRKKNSGGMAVIIVQLK